MQIDPNNDVVKYCTEGMLLEGQGKPEEASKLFKQAWAMAVTDFEKTTAAHYVARHQDSSRNKLQWDQLALSHAELVQDEKIKSFFPSLYLNIAKCHEDLQDWQQAQENYRAGLQYTSADNSNGYNNMIRSGLEAGLARLKAKSNPTQTTRLFLS
jgi:rifampin ADP-ribosylating transferase